MGEFKHPDTCPACGMTGITPDGSGGIGTGPPKNVVISFEVAVCPACERELSRRVGQRWQTGH